MSVVTETRDEILGKYRLIAELGHGGMADVYLAVVCGIAGFNKLLVLKQLRSNLADDPEFLTMFLDEARLAARLNHPNVVQTYEVGQHDSRYFIAMEYLEGQPLRRLISRAKEQGGMPLSLHLQILVHVLSGLHHAHELADYDGCPLRVVHRDVSPHNVFVTYDGQVKVVDFGIAKALDSTAETRAGVLKGKVAYMAPEQAHADAIDRRTDLFAVGVMLWEAVAQQRMWEDVFGGAILQKLVSGQIPSIDEICPDAPEELRMICNRSVAFDPDLRFSSALEFQVALETFLEKSGQRIGRRDIGEFVSALYASERQRLYAIIDERVRLLRSDVASQAELQQTLSSPAYCATVRNSSERFSSHPPIGTSSLGGAAASSPPVATVYRRWPGIFLGAAAVVVGISLVIALLSRQARLDNAPKAVLPQADSRAVPSEVLPAGLPSHPIEIILTLRAQPAEARIFLDGHMLAGNPHSARVLQDGSTHQVRIESPGYISVERQIVYDRSLDIEFSMEKPGRVGAGVPKAVSHTDAASQSTSEVPSVFPSITTSRPPPAKRTKRTIDTDNPWSD